MSGDVCAMCKGSGHIPGDPDPIPCTQCARNAAVIEAARRDRYSEAARLLTDAFGDYVRAGNEMRELWAKMQRLEERRTRLIAEAVLDINATLKGGK